jgi:hypothetical protein
MNFSSFLKQSKIRRSIRNSKEHYLFFDSHKELGISLRHFQDIESGKHPPSEQVFLVIYNKTEDLYKKDCILSFFETVLAGLDSNNLIDFLKTNLKLPIPDDKKKYWDSKLDSYKDYTKEQLEFLSKNEEALRLHKRLLLYDSSKVPLSSVNIDESLIKKMVQLKLISISKNYIKINHSYCRVPRAETSSPTTVTKATDFILEHIPTFISKEGSPNQGLFYVSQLMDHDSAMKIIETQKIFKNELHTLAIDTDKEVNNIVPFVFVSFCKILEKKDLGIYENGK